MPGIYYSTCCGILAIWHTNPGGSSTKVLTGCPRRSLEDFAPLSTYRLWVSDHIVSYDCSTLWECQWRQERRHKCTLDWLSSQRPLTPLRLFGSCLNLNFSVHNCSSWTQVVNSLNTSFNHWVSVSTDSNRIGGAWSLCFVIHKATLL